MDTKRTMPTLNVKVVNGRQSQQMMMGALAQLAMEWYAKQNEATQKEEEPSSAATAI